jgi:peptidoglycan/LPS O-acetylase OafA/YrhL
MWHSGLNATGHLDWDTDWRFLPAIIVPAFFALSGYLVAGSLARNSLPNFFTLRLLRILPALAVEITLSAVIIGLLFTDVPRLQYLADRQFHHYFLNIVGLIHYTLPGVFTHNVGGDSINSQLWTIPFEFECYFSLAILSALTIVRNRVLFLCATIAIAVICTIWVSLHGGSMHMHVPGRALVLSFLAAVVLYQFRDVVPYSNILALFALICACICLQFPIANYIAAFPVAYLTIWLGLMRPPSIPFGDLSYGIYLFHYPIEQTIMHLFPRIDSWWVLSLATLPGTLAFAFLSWNLIEHPILKRKKIALAVVDRIGTSVQGFVSRRAAGPVLQDSMSDKS